MFDDNLNLIVGGRKVGKTLFLLELAMILKSSGYKLCFIGGTDEMPLDDEMMSCFDFARTLSTSKPKEENDKTLELVKEVVNRDKHDFIIVDDVDWMFESSIRSLLRINISKICTCVSVLDSLQNSTRFEMGEIHSDQSPYSISTINGFPVKDFIKSLVRDQKIKNIIK